MIWHTKGNDVITLEERERTASTVTFYNGDIECWTASDSKRDKQKDQTTRKVWSIIPGGQDVWEFKKSGDDHNDSGDSTSQCSSRPSHCRQIAALNFVDVGRVVCHVEVIHGNLNVDNEIWLKFTKRWPNNRFLKYVLKKMRAQSILSNFINRWADGRSMSHICNRFKLFYVYSLDEEHTTSLRTMRAMPSGYQKTCLTSSYPMISLWSFSRRTNLPSTTL